MNARPVVVITGATNGLGRLVALDLARRGAHLGVVARNPAKVEDLRQEIDDVAPGTPVDTFIADLTSLHDVRRAGKEIAAQYDRIDVLINNAGLHAFSQRVTQDGLAEMTAVNYLSPWLLTATLCDKLVASAPARVVSVASEAARHAGSLDPTRDITATADYTRRESSALYGRSKLMGIMFTQELGRRLAGTGVTVNCCDPGFNTSGLGRELPLAGILEKVLKTLRVGDPRRGAGVILRLALEDAFAEVTGGYFSVKDARHLDCPEPGRGKEIQAELWDTTSALLEEALASVE